MLLDVKDLDELGNYSTESLSQFLPGMKVVEEGNFVTISGLRSRDLASEMKRQWKTTRIFNNIFSRSGWRFVKFHKWFAVEAAYVFSTLSEYGSSYFRNTAKVALAKVMERTWLKKTTEKSEGLGFNYSKLKSELNLEMFDYQMAWYKSYEDVVPRYGLKGYMAEAGTGSGKTLLGYGFHVLTEADLTIFLTPKPVLKQVWVDRIKKYFKRPRRHWDSLSGGIFTGKEEIMIVHHDQVAQVLDHVKKINRYKKVNLWIDESHRFTEESTARVKSLYEITDKIDFANVVHASATPLKAQPREAIPFLRTTDPLFDAALAEDYKKVFGSGKATALDMLNNRLGIVKFKVTSDSYLSIKETTETLLVKFAGCTDYTLENVGKVMAEKAKEYVAEYEAELPEIVYDWEQLNKKVRNALGGNQVDIDTHKRYLSMAGTMHENFKQREHLELIKECKIIEEELHYRILQGEDKKRYKQIAPQYKYPVLSIRGKLLGNVYMGMRIKCFTQMAREMELERIVESAIKKTLVFSSYIEPVEAAAEYIAGKGYDPVVVTQKTNKDLDAILKRAEDDEKANPIIATTSSLGTGNEVVVANTTVFVDVPFRDYIYRQAIGRTARASQDTDVFYYECFLDTGDEKNLTTRGMDILAWSKDQVDQMLGTEGDVIESEDIKDIEPETAKLMDIETPFFSWMAKFFGQ